MFIWDFFPLNLFTWWWTWIPFVIFFPVLCLFWYLVYPFVIVEFAWNAVTMPPFMLVSAIILTPIFLFFAIPGFYLFWYSLILVFITMPGILEDEATSG